MMLSHEGRRCVGRRERSESTDRQLDQTQAALMQINSGVRVDFIGPSTLLAIIILPTIKRQHHCQTTNPESAMRDSDGAPGTPVLVCYYSLTGKRRAGFMAGCQHTDWTGGSACTTQSLLALINSAHSLAWDCLLSRLRLMLRLTSCLMILDARSLAPSPILEISILPVLAFSAVFQ